MLWTLFLNIQNLASMIAKFYEILVFILLSEVDNGKSDKLEDQPGEQENNTEEDKFQIAIHFWTSDLPKFK